MHTHTISRARAHTRRALSIAAAALALCCLIAATAAAHAPTTRHRLASCYGPGLYGNHTANGTVLRPTTLGVAMRTGRLGSYVTLAVGRRRVTVRVIDRGPYSGARSVDVTAATARRLGFGSCTAFGVRVLRTSR